MRVHLPILSHIKGVGQACKGGAVIREMGLRMDWLHGEGRGEQKIAVCLAVHQIYHEILPEFPRALHRCHAVPTRNHSILGLPSHLMTSIPGHRARWRFVFCPSSSMFRSQPYKVLPADADPLSTITTDPVVIPPRTCVWKRWVS